MRASIVLTSVVVLLGTRLAAAPQAKAAGLVAASEPGGALALRDGERTIAAFTPKTGPKQRGTAMVRESKLSGHDVLEVRLPVQGEGARREEVWIAERTAAGAKVIWWDFAGAMDPDGETTTTAEVGEGGIQVYQTAARLSRCDALPVRLSPKVWDFSSRAFKAAGPGVPVRAATSVQAHRGGAPEGKPLGGFFFSAASTSAGASGDPSRLRPPAALNDGTPATVWSSDGDARGQLLTARSSGGFPITGLRLLPGDPGSERTFRASGKPRKLSLIFGKNPADNVDVELVEDADAGVKRLGVPFWIALPKPVASSCVTVVLRETSPDKLPVSIADLDVITELDGPEAADRLVESLAQGKACEARQPLLLRLGPPALAKVAAAIVRSAPGLKTPRPAQRGSGPSPSGAPDLKTPRPAQRGQVAQRSEAGEGQRGVMREASGPSPGGGTGNGRECLVEALAALLAAGAPASPEVGTALAAAIPGASATEEKLILKLLPGLAAPPVAAVAAILQTEKRPESDRLLAARALAAISGEEATKALLGAVGQGDQPMRRAMRKAVTSLRPPAALAAKAALDATPTTDTARRAELLLVFAALAKGEPSTRAAALASLASALDGSASFEEKARAIAGLGTLNVLAERDPAVLAKLVELRAHSADGVLRHLAMVEIAASDDPAALPALRAALEDADPRVRETAAEALGHRRDKTSAELLIAGAKQEPWPQVRRSQIAALGELCTPAGNELIQRALKRDVDDVRQVALVALVRCYGAKATPALLQILGRLPESADMRSLAARLLAERKDPTTVRSMAEVLRRLVQEVEADMSLQTVIVDTAMALATIRTPEAISALAGLLSQPNVSVKRAAIDALAIVCDPGVGAAALQTAAKNQDESISIPAAAAAAHCRDRR